MARLLAILLAAAVTTASAASAQVVLDRVVAVVNDDAIFLSDLRERAGPFLARAAEQPTRAARAAATRGVLEQVLEVLINQRLILQAAEADGITVSDADVDEAIAAMVRDSGLGGPAFWAAIGGRGFSSRAAFERDIREQLLQYRVLSARVRGRVSITEEDVRARYDELARSAGAGAVWGDIYREMLSDAMERPQELFIDELRRTAVIERRLDAVFE